MGREKYASDVRKLGGIHWPDVVSLGNPSFLSILDNNSRRRRLSIELGPGGTLVFRVFPHMQLIPAPLLVRRVTTWATMSSPPILVGEIVLWAGV